MADRDPRTYGRFRGRPMSREAAEAIVAAEGGLPVEPKAPTVRPKTTPRRRMIEPLRPGNVEPRQPAAAKPNAITSASVRKVTAPKPRATGHEEDEVDG